MTSEMRFEDSFDSSGSKPKGYKRSYKVFEESTDELIAQCDLCTHIESYEVALSDGNGNAYTVKPNRKVLPSLWTLRDDNGSALFEIERESAIKLFNPLGRKLFTLRDLENDKEYELRNLTKSKLDLMFGPSSMDWYLLEKDKPVAGFDRRKNEKDLDQGKGIFSKIRNFVKSANWILVSNSDQHLISGPAFLVLMVLFESFNNTAE